MKINEKKVKNVGAILSVIVAVLAIGGYFGYTELVKKAVLTQYDGNKTVMMEQSLIDNLIKLRNTQSIELCGYGKYVTSTIIIIDRIDECSDNKYLAIIKGRSDKNCEVSQEEFGLIQEGKFLGMLCSKSINFYDKDSLDMPYKLVTGGKL